MRSARTGGLKGIGITKNERRSPAERDLWGLKMERSSAAKLCQGNPKTDRANVYATPTHTARMTSVYSVSFPV